MVKSVTYDDRPFDHVFIAKEGRERVPRWMFLTLLFIHES